MYSRYEFKTEIKFTETYKKYKDAHPAIREVRCLEQMYPDILQSVKKGDKFAGRICMSYVGFSPEPGGLGYYCDAQAMKRFLSEENCSYETKTQVEELLLFWEQENTTAKVRAAYPPEIAKALPHDEWAERPMAAAPLYRMAGSYLDYEKLLENGIPGMEHLIAVRRQEAEKRGEDKLLFEGMFDALQLLKKCMTYYRSNALQMKAQTDDPKEKENFQCIADTLKNISEKKPETLREAMQLMWLYALISGTFNYGRMDVMFGEFLVRDLEKNVISIEEAQKLFVGLWRVIADRKTTWNGRVILGGKGRKHEENADQAALLAMEASRVVTEAEPQLTLRIYKGMNPELMNKALEVIGAGRTYPMLYNDEVNIPAVSSAFGVDSEEAQNYVPFGCGEYVLDHRSYGSPNGIINLLKVLELTLRNGRDGITGEQTGPVTGEFKNFHTFEELWNAYDRQIRYFVEALAVQEEIEYKIAGETAPFLFLSMLYDDCIERGKGIFSGGIKYLGGTVETYGNINTADSLTAIKELVYDKKVLTQERLLQILDVNFIGYEKERKMLKEAAKYGNDEEAADKMAVRVHEHICNTVKEQTKRVGLHSYLVVIINNSANTTLGKLTAASADGREKGFYMANANNPWGGNDRKGLTAMLNSLVKLRPDIHAGAVQNMKFSPELFKDDAVIITSVLKSYFEKGGTQAMISVVRREDLERAMLYPENYRHLFVRVGGFSARFVELERAVQEEIVSRTLYE